MQICKNLGISGGNYTIHTYEKPSHGWKHFLLINRRAFYQAVRENLPLFQYVLGPTITPEKLFTQLTNPKESFSSVFKDDKVLIGIVLGFGQQNALYGSRLETVDEYQYARESPPFKSIKMRLKEPATVGSSHSKVKISPSYGYPSLELEFEDLGNSMVISKDLVDSTPLIPWFSCLESKETDHLTRSYSRAQKRIQKALSSADFLEELCTQVFKNGKENNNSSFTEVEMETTFLHSLIGGAIFQGIETQDANWIESFIEGMRASDTGKSDDSALPSLFTSYQKASEELKAKQDLYCL